MFRAVLNYFNKAKLRSIIRWFDTNAAVSKEVEIPKSGIFWSRSISYIIIHLICFGVIWVGWSWVAVGTAIGLYFVRMFAITGFYHRYFSHRSYKTNRFGSLYLHCLGIQLRKRVLFGGPPTIDITTALRTGRKTSIRPRDTVSSGAI